MEQYRTNQCLLARSYFDARQNKSDMVALSHQAIVLYYSQSSGRTLIAMNRNTFSGHQD